MAAAPAQHHHRSTTKHTQKPFKSRFTSKNALKEISKGKVENTRGKGHARSLKSIMSKTDRKNQARQKQHAKHQEHLKATGVFSGQNGAPRIVAIVPLSEKCDAEAAIKSLNASVGTDDRDEVGQDSVVKIERFKQSIQYIPTGREIFDVLNACQLADFVVFILSAIEEVDGHGEKLLQTIEGQGVSNVITVVQGLDSVEPAKRRPQTVTSLRSYISHFFPNQDKLNSLDSTQECANAIRSLCTTNPRGIRWRDDRSWMLVSSVDWSNQADQTASVTTSVSLTGVVRGKNLKANRLVQVGDWGTFQIEKIMEAPPLNPKKRKSNEMSADEDSALKDLDTPDADQDELAELAPDDVIMEDRTAQPDARSERKGVLLDDHHYYSEEEPESLPRPRRLPRGTSAYQAAWYLDDFSDSGSDLETVDDNIADVGVHDPAMPEDGIDGTNKSGVEGTEAAPSEYQRSEMFIDQPPNEEEKQIEEYRRKKRKEAKDDLEFPDEIELHPNVLARERLAKYRGLRSLRTSAWATEEDRPYEPEDWSRLLQVPDYKKAKSSTMTESFAGGVPAGQRVHVVLRGVPRHLQGSPKPLTMFSLLRHEHKRVVVNYSITLSSESPEPVKSKTPLIMQCGPRRFLVNPIFSQPGNTPNNVHKFCRYLHPGQTTIATFIAPLTWGSVPALFFRKGPTGTSPNLIATGTSLAPDQSRIIAKRVILTGHPYKIHKKLVTIRYMFFNMEDVHWFKALQLWTRRGRSGFIKESLGTHGYFKATFDAKINPQDSVGISLYKRVFPRTAMMLDQAELRKVVGQGDEAKSMEKDSDVQMAV